MLIYVKKTIFKVVCCNKTFILGVFIATQLEYFVLYKIS